MNYQIIRDLTELEKFINMLVNLEDGESYLIRLITRAKYVRSVTKDFDLKTITVTDKNDIIKSIRQLECEIGTYDGLLNDDIGIYISLNPRSHEVCIKKTFLKYGDLLGKYKHQDPLSIFYFNLRSSCSRKLYFDIDFDSVDVDSTVANVSNYLNMNCVNILPSKAGVHFIIDLNMLDSTNYPNSLVGISTILGYDRQMAGGDNMIPIPGCSQFGFIPKFTKRQEPPYTNLLDGIFKT